MCNNGGRDEQYALLQRQFRTIETVINIRLVNYYIVTNIASVINRLLPGRGRYYDNYYF